MWINLILLTIYVFNGRTLNQLKANCCQHSRSLITSLCSVTIGSERGRGLLYSTSPSGRDKGEGLAYYLLRTFSSYCYLFKLFPCCKGYLGNYAPPFGGGVRGRGCLMLCGVHIKPSTDSHTIQHIAVGGTDSREARLSKRIVRNIVQSL